MSKTDGFLYVVPTPLNEDVGDFYTVEQKKIFAISNIL